MCASGQPRQALDMQARSTRAFTCTHPSSGMPSACAWLHRFTPQYHVMAMGCAALVLLYNSHYKLVCAPMLLAVIMS
jgi:type VI protein secretion system component VasF